MISESKTFVLGGLQQKPKLNICKYCTKPALKATCGGYECRRKHRADYNKNRLVKKGSK